MCCDIVFTVIVPELTPPGEPIYIAGSLPEIGEWRPDGFVLNFMGGTLWQGQVVASCDQTVEYSYNFV